MTIRNILLTGTTALVLGAASLASAQDMNRSGSAPGTNTEMNRGADTDRGTTANPSAANPATNSGAANRAGSVDAGTLAAAKDGNMTVQPFSRSVDDVEGMDVIGTNNQKIGDVENVLVDSSGQPIAVSIEAGGFLGIGARQVVVQISDLKLQDDRLISNMSKDQVSALPEWNE